MKIGFLMSGMNNRDGRTVFSMFGVGEIGFDGGLEWLLGSGETGGVWRNGWRILGYGLSLWREIMRMVHTFSIKAPRLGLACWLGLAAVAGFAQSPWTVNASGTTVDLAGAAYRFQQASEEASQGLLVAVGAQGVIVTSADQGASWVRRESGTTAALTAVALLNSGSRFVAVGERGVILSSSDGVVWTRESVAATVRLNAVDSLGRAVGEAGVGVLTRATNGTWTQRDAGFGDRSMRALVPGRGVVVGQGGAIFSSTNDFSSDPPFVRWESTVSPVTADLEAATSGGFFSGAPPVVVGAQGMILQLDRSVWLARTSGTQQHLRGVCYKGGFLTLITSINTISVGEYFAVGDAGVVLRSANGTAWQPDLVPTQRSLRAIVSTADYVVAVGEGGVVVRAGGPGALPTITRQPVVRMGADGRYVAEAGVSGQGALTYNWVQFTAGRPYPVGTDYPVQSLARPPFGVNVLPFQLLVANAFGTVRSELFTPNRFLNLASRAVVGSGERVLIAGFALGGSADDLRHTRTMLIRAVGPALVQFGVFAALAAPRLTLFAGSQVVASNAGWSNNADAVAIRAATDRTGAFPLATGAADSALLVTLPPGNYTAQVTSGDGATGVALVELYDLDQPELSRLKNVSTRMRVQGGEGVPITGFVIDGGVKKSVLLRAAGPALAGFGVGEVLARPRLTLYRNGQVVATAAGWGAATNVTAIRAAAAAVNAFAFGEGSADTALLTDLEPGTYSLLVSAADGGTGVTLVEVYEVP